MGVYVRYSTSVHTTGKIFKALPSKVATGWRHVRHVPSTGNWHPGNDDCRGTFATGTPSSYSSAAAWAKKFDQGDIKQYLFTVGDGSNWAVVNKSTWLKSTGGGWGKIQAVSSNIYRNGGAVNYAYARQYKWQPMVYSHGGSKLCTYQVYQEANWSYCNSGLRMH